MSFKLINRYRQIIKYLIAVLHIIDSENDNVTEVMTMLHELREFLQLYLQLSLLDDHLFDIVRIISVLGT